MLKAESLAKVLPGVKTVEEGGFLIGLEKQVYKFIGSSTQKSRKGPKVFWQFVLQNLLLSPTLFWLVYFLAWAIRAFRGFWWCTYCWNNSNGTSSIKIDSALLIWASTQSQSFASFKPSVEFGFGSEL